MITKTTGAALLAVLALGAGLTTQAEAAPGARHHPRVAQVLGRTHHQAVRINEERREGDLTGAEARALRASNRAIAQQTVATAHANGGHLTRADQRNLNAQLNAQSRAIGR